MKTKKSLVSIFLTLFLIAVPNVVFASVNISKPTEVTYNVKVGQSLNVQVEARTDKSGRYVSVAKTSGSGSLDKNHNTKTKSTITGNYVYTAPSSPRTETVVIEVKEYVKFIGYINTNTKTKTVTINVIPADDSAPVLMNPGNKSVNENGSLNFVLQASDANGDIISYSMTNAPAGAVINSATGAFSYNPNYDVVIHPNISKDYNVTFTVAANSKSDSKAIILTVNDINRDPVLNSIGNKTINENSLLNFTVTASDPDNDAVTITAQNIPSGASFANNAFSWTPNYNQAGNYNVAFAVSDAKSSDSENVSITVNNLNRAPVLTSPGNKTINENNLLTFAVSASDPDNDAITITAQNLPSGANFSNNTFSWTPSYSQAGSYNVTFTASDGNLTNSKTITITVNNVNRAPTANNQSVVTEQDAAKSVILSAADPDNDSLIYSIVSGPSHGALTGALPNVLYTPSTNYNGSDSFTFKVNDGTADSNIAAVSITINAEANHAPVLSPVGDKNISVNQILNFNISAADPDNDALTYSVINLPSGANFDPAAKSFNWTPSNNQAGTYSITFIVTDGELSDSETISINVIAVPQGQYLYREGLESGIQAVAELGGGNSFDANNAEHPYSGAKCLKLHVAPNVGWYTGTILNGFNSGGETLNFQVYSANAVNIKIVFGSGTSYSGYRYYDSSYYMLVTLGAGWTNVSVAIPQAASSTTGIWVIGETSNTGFDIYLDEMRIGQPGPRPPVWVGPASIQKNLSENISQQLFTSDIPITQITSNPSTLPNGLSVSRQESTSVILTGASGAIYDGDITFACTNAGGSTQGVVHLKITDPAAPQSPVLSVIPDAFIQINNLLDFTITAIDPNIGYGDSLTFSVTNGSQSGMQIQKISDTTARFTWTPSQEGDYSVTIQVRDTAQLTDAKTFIIKVYPEGSGYVFKDFGKARFSDTFNSLTDFVDTYRFPLNESVDNPILFDISLGASGYEYDANYGNYPPRYWLLKYWMEDNTYYNWTPKHMAFTEYVSSGAGDYPSGFYWATTPGLDHPRYGTNYSNAAAPSNELIDSIPVKFRMFGRFRVMADNFAEADQEQQPLYLVIKYKDNLPSSVPIYSYTGSNQWTKIGDVGGSYDHMWKSAELTVSFNQRIKDRTDGRGAQNYFQHDYYIFRIGNDLYTDSLKEDLYIDSISLSVSSSMLDLPKQGFWPMPHQAAPFSDIRNGYFNTTEPPMFIYGAYTGGGCMVGDSRPVGTSPDNKWNNTQDTWKLFNYVKFNTYVVLGWNQAWLGPLSFVTTSDGADWVRDHLRYSTNDISAELHLKTASDNGLKAILMLQTDTMGGSLWGSEGIMINHKWGPQDGYEGGDDGNLHYLSDVCVRAADSQWKNALLGFYPIDEWDNDEVALGKPLEYAVEVYNRAKDAGISSGVTHPTMTTLMGYHGRTAAERVLKDNGLDSDIIAIDTYIYTWNQYPRSVFARTHEMATDLDLASDVIGNRTDKAVIAVPEGIEIWPDSEPQYFNGVRRLANAQEIVGQAYLAICHDVDGVLFFHAGHPDMNCSYDPSGPENIWNGFKQVGHELHGDGQGSFALAQLLVAPSQLIDRGVMADLTPTDLDTYLTRTVRSKNNIVAINNNQIHFIYKILNGERYLILFNPDDMQSKTVTVTLSDLTTANYTADILLDADPDITVINKTFTISINPYGRRVIKIAEST